MKAFLIASVILVLCAPLAVAAEMDIHSMVVNDKILELVDTRQLSFAEDGEVGAVTPSPDFKQIAFLSTDENDTVKLCLVNSTGGKVTAVITTPSPWRLDEVEKLPRELWVPEGPVSWSPDGQLLALKATRCRLIIDDQGKAHVPTDAPESADVQEYVLVLERNGAFKTAIPVPKEIKPYGEPVFSPDSSLIASAYYVEQDDFPNGAGVVVFSHKDDGSKIIYTGTKLMVHIRGWKPDGRSIVCKTGLGSASLKRVWLDGRPAEDLEGSWEEGLDSPDGAFRCEPRSGDPGICFKNLQTGELVQAVRDPEGKTGFTGWASNSRMFVYTREETIVDKPNSREKEIDTLWLAHLGASKPNAMCIALDHSWRTGPPRVSPDCTRVVYVNERGRLCIAQLAWRDLTAEQKQAAGLPLTEKEEAELIMENAKWVGRAMRMYATDWDGAYPAAESVEDDLKPYAEAISPSDKGNLFNRPGTGQRIFNYLVAPGTSVDDVGDGANTPVAEFDAGYGWKIVLYADGHVKQESK